jgi:hypothetical protein
VISHIRTLRSSEAEASRVESAEKATSDTPPVCRLKVRCRLKEGRECRCMGESAAGEREGGRLAVSGRGKRARTHTQTPSIDRLD